MTPPAGDHVTSTGAGPRPGDHVTSPGAGLRAGDHAGQPGGAARSLADRQAELVGTLTSGAPVPEGFDARLVETARVALLRKRAGEVAKAWPALAASHGREWNAAFARWAATRPTQGSLRDGWDLAREVGAGLRSDAAEELAAREALQVYDGEHAPRPRRLPAVRRGDGGVLIQVAGRLRTLRWPSG
ncbi:hypothetical protein Acsp02_08880 [Actinoplanes sp. NBRC 103695]|nr:hypothetical protein Acsp02_08880 [Actinoplanes sp. NBRC 103695]